MNVSKTAWHALTALAFYEGLGFREFGIYAYPPAIGGFYLSHA
jgi:hypothetical protein